MFIIKELGNLEIMDDKITANSKVAEAKACVKKYFNDASVVIIFLVLVIRGIKERRLISNPIQAPNQELAEIVINDPLRRDIRNKSLVGLLSIRKKKIKTSINGV